MFDFLVLARWVHFVSIFLLFGCSLFWLFCVPIGRTVALHDLKWAAARTTSLVRVAAPLAALSGVAWLLATIANMTGAFDGVFDRDTLHAFFFQTAFGPLEMGRLVLLAFLAGLAFAPLRVRFRMAAVAATSGLLLVSQAWLGHAAEDGGTLYGAAMIGSYATHVLASAAWIGGLPPLLLAISELRGGAKPAARIAHLLSRYSLMAFLAVTLILASGVANTSFHAGLAPRRLFDEAYGQILLVKVGLVAIMLALGGYNRFILMPRLERTPGASMARDSRLYRSIGVECVLGLLVLGCAAVLGITPPIR